VLEASEGLQVAKELAAARERAHEMQAQVTTAGTDLEAARQSVRASATGLERLRVRFEKMKAESVAHLRELSSVATGESYWEVVAFSIRRGAAPGEWYLYRGSIRASSTPDRHSVTRSCSRRSVSPGYVNLKKYIDSERSWRQMYSTPEILKQRASRN